MFRQLCAGAPGALAFAASLLIAGAAAPVAAQEAGRQAMQAAVGDWIGTLEVNPQASLRIAVHIESAADGSLSGTMDSLDQNAMGIPLERVEADGGALAFTVPAIGGSYEGLWNAGVQAWEGEWSQSGASFPLVLVAGTGEPSALPEIPDNWQIPDDAAIAALIDQRIALREGAGMVVGVLEDGARRVVARGPDGAPAFDEHTLFEIGSMTKVFTALLLADMVLAGEVGLDDPVARHLPEGATMPTRGGQQISLRHLAMHSSGLPRLPDNMPYADPADPYADYGEAELLAFLASYELPRDIGAEREYSNLGAGLLGYALARAVGTDYASLVRERITGPLGMADTTIALSPDQQARLATPHDAYMQPTAPWTFTALAGAGALRSTAADMLTFVAAAADPQSPIGPAMALALEPRAPFAQMLEIALGWMVFTLPGGGEVAMHGGGTGGFRTMMAVDRGTGRAVVALTNSAVEPGTEDMALHLLTGLPLAKAEPVPPAPAAPSREEISLSQAELERFVGTYRLAGGAEVIVARDGAQLTAAVTGQPRFPIYPSGPLTFFWRVVDAEVTFTEQDGAITGGIFRQDGRETPVTRIR